MAERKRREETEKQEPDGKFDFFVMQFSPENEKIQDGSNKDMTDGLGLGPDDVEQIELPTKVSSHNIKLGRKNGRIVLKREGPDGEDLGVIDIEAKEKPHQDELNEYKKKLEKQQKY